MRLRAVDPAILRELLRWEGNQPEGALRFPVRDIARRSGVHPNTVRARLLALRKGGVIEGATFEPWPRLVGLVHAGWMVEPVRTRGVPALLPDFPSVSQAIVGLDWAFLHVWEGTDAACEATARRFARACGPGARIERHFTSSSFPPSHADALELTALDWRLILALRARDDTRKLAAIAREARVTPRTIERRVKRVFDAGGGGMFPLVRPSRIEGQSIAHIIVPKGDERAPASLAHAFPDRIAGPWGRGVNTGVAFLVSNLHEADEAAARAEMLPGIHEARVILYRDVLANDAFEAYLRGVVSRLHKSPLRAEKSSRKASPKR